jgi:phospholipase/carboxylesterase
MIFNNSQMKVLFLLVFLISFSLTFAQENNGYRPRLRGFEYMDVVKGDPSLGPPLLIAFHYSSGTPNETLNDYDKLSHPVRIIIPKGNYRKRNGFSYYPVDYYKKDSATQFSLSRIAVDSIARFVQAIEKKYGQKAIVSGISQGGDIALLLSIYHPDLCIASFPFAAVINPEIVNTLKNIQGIKVPVHMFQGEADQIVSIAYTRSKITDIEKFLPIRLYTYPEVGHDISKEMKEDYSKLINEIIKK